MVRDCLVTTRAGSSMESALWWLFRAERGKKENETSLMKSTKTNGEQQRRCHLVLEQRELGLVINDGD
jgi:hypothetical protein